MASSIEATFGLGLEPWTQGLAKIETDAARLDANLQKVGVTMGEAPKKLAAESAKAFEDIYSGEAKLADYRNKVAFSRLSDEQKMQVLVQESLELREKAAAIEGQSVEKSELMLESEKKKQQAREIGIKAQQESLSVQKSNTHQVDEESKKLSGIPGILNGIKDGFKGIGISLKGAGIGIGIAVIVRLAKEAIDNAQKLNHELMAAGKPVDSATRSMAAFGDMIDGAKKMAVNAVGYIIGGWTQIADVIASGTKAAAGFGEAQQEAARRSAFAAEEMEKRVKKARQENNDPDKIRDAEKALVAAREKDAFDRANHEERIGKLKAQILDLDERINTGGATGVKLVQMQNELVERKKTLTAEINAKIDEHAARELTQITTRGQLDQTYAEKTKTLMAERNALESQRFKLSSAGLDTAETELKVQANAVALTKLQRDYEEAGRVEIEKQIEATELLAKSKHKLTTAEKEAAKEAAEDIIKQNEGIVNLSKEDRARYDIISLQNAEKRNQREIDQIMLKGAEKLDATEKARVQTILEQNRQIVVQISKQEKVIEKAKELKALELERQQIIQGLSVGKEKRAAEVSAAKGSGGIGAVEKVLTDQAASISKELADARKLGDAALVDALTASLADVTAQFNTVKSEQAGGYLSGLIGHFRSQADFANTNTEILKEILRRNEEMIKSIDQRPVDLAESVTNYLGRGFEKAPLGQENKNIQKELDARAQLLRDNSFGGYSQALRNYKGDPFNFDTFYSQTTSGKGAFDDTNSLLKETNALLKGKFRNG